MNRLASIAGISLSLLCGIAVALACHRGAGLESDTMSYFAFPESGRLADLPVHHGILYPLVLFLFTSTGLSLAKAAVAVNVICSAATTWFVLRIMSAGANKICAAWPIIATFLAAFSIPFLSSHASALSEPLFLTLIAGGIAFLVRNFSDNRNARLLATAAFLALACLTRFAGLAFVGTACLALVLLPRPDIRRIGRAVVFGAACVLPLAAVLVWNGARHGSATNREIAFHMFPYDTLCEGSTTIASWFAPYRVLLVSQLIAFAIAAAAACFLIAAIIKGLRNREPVPAFLALCGFVYMAFLAANICFVDVSIMLSQRMLSPLALLLLPLAAVMLARAPAGRASRLLVGCAVGYMTLFTAVRVYGFVKSMHATGSGFSSVAWDNSALVALASDLAGGHTMFSNAADAFHLRGVRGVGQIPWRQRSTSNRDMPAFGDEFARMKDSLTNRGACLASISLRYWPPYLAGEDEIVKACALVAVVSSADGVMYAAKGSPLAAEIARRAVAINATRGNAALRIHQP